MKDCCFLTAPVKFNSIYSIPSNPLQV